MICESHFIRQAKEYYYKTQTTRSASNKSMLSDSMRK